MPSIYDMGPPALLPHPKGRHTEGFFIAQKKSEGFGRVRTRDLGYNSPACYHCATEALKSYLNLSYIARFVFKFRISRPINFTNEDLNLV